MTIKDILLGVLGLFALLLWTAAYGPCFLVRDCWRWMTGRKVSKL